MQSLGAVGFITNWFWTVVDGSMLHKAIVRLLYFPSILRMSLFEGPKRRWYDRVDSTVLLGALPFRSQTKKLVEEENVRAVLSYNEEYELKFFTNSKEEWAKSGVARSWFSTIDYQPPSFQDINEGISTIIECKRKEESVYVHCRAGKGRSAMVTTCYLIKCYGYTPEEAIKFLQSKRPQVTMNPRQRKRIVDFHEHLKLKEE